MLEHVLDQVSTLLEVAASEIKETLSKEQKDSLGKGSVVKVKLGNGKEEDATNATRSANLDKSSQHLTAVLRRALPTLRIVSKWLIAHAGYLARTSQSPPPYPSLSSSSSSSSNPANGSSSAIPPKIHHLWTSYATLLNTLFVAFPFSELQSLVDPLEEDLEMKGFGPLGKRMGENWTGARLVLNKGIAKREEGGGGLHPNEEMLMRIWDLEKDGKGMASGEEGDAAAGVLLIGGRFASREAPEEQRVLGNGDRKQKKVKREVVEEDARTTLPEPPVKIVEPVKERTVASPPSSPPPTSLAAPILPTKVAREPTPSPEASPVINTALVEQASVAESHHVADEQKEEDEETEEEETALDDADSGSHASALEHDLELASVSTETEDDPVNRAMRAALDDGESALGDEDEFPMNEGRGEFQDEEEDERIVWPAPVGRRDTVTAGSTRWVLASPISFLFWLLDPDASLTFFFFSPPLVPSRAVFYLRNQPLPLLLLGLLLPPVVSPLTTSSSRCRPRRLRLQRRRTSSETGRDPRISSSDRTRSTISVPSGDHQSLGAHWEEEDQHQPPPSQSRRELLLGTGDRSRRRTTPAGWEEEEASSVDQDRSRTTSTTLLPPFTNTRTTLLPNFDSATLLLPRTDTLRTATPPLPPTKRSLSTNNNPPFLLSSTNNSSLPTPPTTTSNPTSTEDFLLRMETTLLLPRPTDLKVSLLREASLPTLPLLLRPLLSKASNLDTLPRRRSVSNNLGSNNSSRTSSSRHLQD